MSQPSRSVRDRWYQSLQYRRKKRKKKAEYTDSTGQLAPLVIGREGSTSFHNPHHPHPPQSRPAVTRRGKGEGSSVRTSRYPGIRRSFPPGEIRRRQLIAPRTGCRDDTVHRRAWVKGRPGYRPGARQLARWYGGKSCRKGRNSARMPTFS